MREISTHVDIDADASLVWHILTDFAKYQRWNPLLRNVQGAARRGDTIVITEKRTHNGKLARSSRSAMVRRTVKHVREPHELFWRGGWAADSIYATERRFRIEALSAGGVRFHQSERFGGLAVPFLWLSLRRECIPAFQAMNQALKARAERAEAEIIAARTRSGGTSG
jgi:hypothetical protein